MATIRAQLEKRQKREVPIPEASTSEHQEQYQITDTQGSRDTSSVVGEGVAERINNLIGKIQGWNLRWENHENDELNRELLGEGLTPAYDHSAKEAFNREARSLLREHEKYAKELKDLGYDYSSDIPENINIPKLLELSKVQRRYAWNSKEVQDAYGELKKQTPGTDEWKEVSEDIVEAYEAAIEQRAKIKFKEIKDHDKYQDEILKYTREKILKEADAIYDALKPGGDIYIEQEKKIRNSGL
jgi:hypothetical protein